MVVNLMNTKKIKWKALHVLCAAFLSLLVQIPLHAMDVDIYEYERLSMSEKKIRNLVDLEGNKITVSDDDFGTALEIFARKFENDAVRVEEIARQYKTVADKMLEVSFVQKDVFLQTLDTVINNEKITPESGKKFKKEEFIVILEDWKKIVSNANKAEDFELFQAQFKKGEDSVFKAYNILINPLKIKEEKLLELLPEIKNSIGILTRNKDRYKRKAKVAEGINVMYALAVNNPSSLFKSLKGEIKDFQENPDYNLAYHYKAQEAIDAVKAAVESGYRVKGVTTKMAVLLKALDAIAEGTLNGFDVSSDIASLQNKINALNSAVDAEKELRNPTLKTKKSRSSKTKSSSTKGSSTKGSSTKGSSTNNKTNNTTFNPFG